jgi:ABC-2 type transport system ATP-binding protein
MKILAGLLEPTSGDAAVLGRRVAGNGDFVRRNIGYMPDFIGVYEDLTVSEYLEFFAAAYGVRRAAQERRRAGAGADRPEIQAGRLVDSLSRGMTQRSEPRPRAGARPAGAAARRARQRPRPAGADRDPRAAEGAQRLGKTILISSHILSELGEFCNKLGIIERGKLLVSGTIDDLMARARAHPVIAVQVLDEPELAVAALRADPRVDRSSRATASCS